MRKQHIVCAAMRNEKTGLVICSPRHIDRRCREVMSALGELGDEHWVTATQGFVDQFGEFLTRKEAYEIAESNGQVLPRGEQYKPVLYSESLY